MRDIEFYAQVSAWSTPWFVEDVDLSIEKQARRHHRRPPRGASVALPRLRG